jgi:hypothetical protein
MVGDDDPQEFLVFNGLAAPETEENSEQKQCSVNPSVSAVFASSAPSLGAMSA